MDINATTLRELMIGNRATFQRALSSRENADDHRRVATVVNSTSRTTRFPWLGQAPMMREWLGERVVKRLQAHSYQITNKRFEMTVGVPVDAIEDDEFGTYAPLFQEMGMSAAEWPNKTVFSFLREDGENAEKPAYDGKAFFAVDHDFGGTYSNLAAGGGTPWYLLDVSRPIKPLFWQLRKKPDFVPKNNVTDDNVFFDDEILYGSKARGAAGWGLPQLAYKSYLTLDETNFRTARAAMMGLRNDEGSSLGIMPRLLVVPPELEVTAEKLLKASFNDAGATNVNSGKAELFVTNYVAE